MTVEHAIFPLTIRFQMALNKYSKTIKLLVITDRAHIRIIQFLNIRCRLDQDFDVLGIWYLACAVRMLYYVLIASTIEKNVHTHCVKMVIRQLADLLNIKRYFSARRWIPGIRLDWLFQRVWKGLWLILHDPTLIRNVLIKYRALSWRLPTKIEWLCAITTVKSLQKHFLLNV